MRKATSWRLKLSEADVVLVNVKGVDKVFRRGSEEIQVLVGLDLEIPEGYCSGSERRKPPL